MQIRKANMAGFAEAIDEYRVQVVRILTSRTFSTSRQVQDFLRFTSDLAFQGRTQVDQAEIALTLLGKSAAFNPVEDASVRRIATLTRQKLGQYYENEGATDRVVVTLPHRSYLPVFQIVATVTPAPAPPPAEPPAAAPEDSVWLGYAGVAAVLLLMGVLLARQWSAGTPALELVTRKGEIGGPANNVDEKGIYLGPAWKAGHFQDSIVRLRFSPERSAQQAGLALFRDPNNFVRLGRVFQSRVSWEFDAESAGHLLRPPGTWTYDPSGQDGTPVWLCLRRGADSFRAMISRDARHWQPIGNPLPGAGLVTEGRLALFGLNGNTGSPGVPAVFDALSTGIQFNALPDELPATGAFPGWTVNSSCGDGVQESASQAGLGLAFRNAEPCTWSFTRPAPEADWEIATRLDFSPVGGAQAGLVLAGETGTQVRFVRSANNGGVITVEVPARGITRSAADFPGHPPIEMRLESKSGELQARFSRDGVTYSTLPLGLPTREIGRKLAAGLEFHLSSWNQVDPLPAAAHFEFIREEFRPLSRLLSPVRY